ncbi:PaaI family thioesterase [Flavobacterium sp.]|uniref:PaaI family thioesterase n=1 Tax=Flavobacterium sp. TaxID=239 RepID=UPI003341DD4F
MNETHYRKLENMYHSGPINQKSFPDVQLTVSEGRAEITMTVQHDYFHAGQSLHGSVYFKMLDDAAYFAVNSQITDSFVYTTSFHIQILRPLKTGVITAIGTVQFVSRNLFIGDAVLYDAKGREVARGTGNFMKSGLALDESLGYQ